MSAQPLPKLTVEEYLEIERTSDTKHEFFAGQMYDMAGGTYEHAILVPNLIVEIGSRLKGTNCRIASNDLLVRTAPDGLHTYPDITIICGEPNLADDQRDVLLNPILLVEVLSKSTEAHDRGTKFAEYRRIETLRDYVLVSQTEPRVEVFSRAEGATWTLRDYAGLEAACELPAIDCSLPLADIYRGVRFEPAF